MNYFETIRYIESFINYEKIPQWPYKESLKLERIKNFLSSIDNPQNNLRCIHIAGSKGKGSTCAFIAYILKEHGFKVGLYTSPHLSDFRERIRILDRRPSSVFRYPQNPFEGMISKKELIELVQRLKPTIEKYNKDSLYGPLSFFEVYTSLAFAYFKEKKVDFAVLETGLGGRLDATNVIDPLVCIITPISYEHTQKLGNTLREIAQEKAGIIKDRRPCLAGRQASSVARDSLIVISALQEKEVIKVIRNRCKEVGAKLYEVKKYKNLKINLLGQHQIVNANVAVAAVEALKKYGFKIKKEAIKKGLAKSIWPGRCEVISERPCIILDGAQNIASAKVLKKTIKENFQYKKLILILGISKDKDIQGICNELNNLASIIILTKANNPRATNPKEIAKYFKNKTIHLTNSAKEARMKAIELADSGDLILVTGSLFVVGEFREINAPACRQAGITQIFPPQKLADPPLVEKTRLHR